MRETLTFSLGYMEGNTSAKVASWTGRALAYVVKSRGIKAAHGAGANKDDINWSVRSDSSPKVQSSKGDLVTA